MWNPRGRLPSLTPQDGMRYQLAMYAKSLLAVSTRHRSDSYTCNLAVATFSITIANSLADSSAHTRWELAVTLVLGPTGRRFYVCSMVILASGGRLVMRLMLSRTSLVVELVCSHQRVD